MQNKPQFLKKASFGTKKTPAYTSPTVHLPYALGQKQAAVAVAEKTEAVIEGEAVAVFPAVADEG